MGELREIVSVDATGRLFALLAFGLPLAGGIFGLLWGTRHKKIRSGVLWGFGAGMLGPLNWLLWLVYNVLTNQNGLDTVRNVFVNLAVFVVVGAVIGMGAGTILRRSLLALNKPIEEDAPPAPQMPDASA